MDADERIAQDRVVEDRIAQAAAVRPSPRQLAWQRLGFTGFLHFGMNTMTDREWGTGDEDPVLFDPTDLDARQWARVAKDAGMSGLILTAKHHDGFCLWPTSTTAHSVASSPWRGGRGDVVREVADACAAEGIRFGVYLSPWDRNSPHYGTGAAYDDLYVAQLTELLTGYGPLFAVWMDGAMGEGPDGRRQHYDWDRYVATVRRFQPGAVASICGGDVRWCGNEAGETRADEWSVLPSSLRFTERLVGYDAPETDESGRRIPRIDDEDLGSRDALLASDEELAWSPAEVDTSIRPGWFHHDAEDARVRSADELFRIHRRSVGGNAMLLLNVPPDRHGRIREVDAGVLAELGARIRSLDERDVAGTAVREDTADGVVLRWSEPQTLVHVILEEDIEHGQLVDGAEVAVVRADAAESVVAELGSIGFRRIVDLGGDGGPGVPDVRELRIRITSARAAPRLSRVGAVSAG